jgi:hypothetical protein
MATATILLGPARGSRRGGCQAGLFPAAATATPGTGFHIHRCVSQRSSRLKDELDDTCLDVTDISVRGWKLKEGNVEEKVRELKEIVSTADEKRTTIVYQLFDNVRYYTKKPDGGRELPSKVRDGKYHVEGRLG